MPDWKGLSAGKTLENIAKKHKCPLKDIEEQFKLGVKVETYEHGKEYAEDITRDHLCEFPDYYDRLEKMEEEAEKEENEKDPDEVKEDVEEQIEEAEENKPDFDKQLKAYAKAVGGIAITVPVKSVKREVEKVIEDYDGDVEENEDSLRGACVIDGIDKNKKKRAECIKKLKDFFEVTDVEDRFDKPLNGYADVKINVDQDGLASEVQLHSPRSWFMKLRGYKMYKTYRSATATRQKQLSPKMEKTYKYLGATWDAMKTKPKVEAPPKV